MSHNQSQNNLREFIEQLLKEKEVDYLDAEVYQKLVDNLVNRAEDQIKAAIVAEIPGKKLEEFEELLKEDNAQKLQDFISKNVSNTKEVAANALIRFRTAYLGSR